MISRLWDSLEETIIGLLLVSMTLLVFVEVFMRFFLNTGFMWLEELTLHMSAWMVLFGAGYGVRVGAHIGVDAFINHLPRQTRRLLGALAVILSIVYCGLIAYGAWVYLAKLRMIGIELEDLPVQKSLAHSILLFGMILLAVRLFELLIRIIRGSSLGFETVDEARKALEDLQNRENNPGPETSGPAEKNQ